MHWINSVRGWVGSLAELGISIIALGVVLGILFDDIPFLPVDVTGNVIAFVNALGSQGLVGLVALGVTWWAFSRRA
jgi:hypothetical protein